MNISIDIVKTGFIIFLAGLCEIGGGYLVWLWLREDKPVWYGVAGASILPLYGVVATLQASNFAKVYATYGGIFIVMSLLWAYVLFTILQEAKNIDGNNIANYLPCVQPPGQRNNA